MKTKFILKDNINNIEKEGTAVVKFNFENKDYIIYSIPENEENCQIFSSRLILNSEGLYFLDNITPEEKNKLNTIIYNLIILIPTEAKKGTNPSTLLNDISNKHSIKVSADIPELSSQEYYNNCSFAITNKMLVDEAITFYGNTLTEKKEEPVIEVPTWNIPTQNESIVNDNLNNNIQPEVEINNINNNIQPEVEINNPIDANQQIPNNNINITVPDTTTIPEAVNSVQDITSENFEIPNINNIPNNGEITPNLNQATPQVNIDNNVNNITPNNEINQPMMNTAVVSDPSLVNITGEANGNIPNINNNNNNNNKPNGGFVVNKYVIIGTICLVLAIAVVIVAYILIKQKTTGV